MGGAIASFPHTPSWRARDTFTFLCIAYFSVLMLKKRPSMNAYSMKETNKQNHINRLVGAFGPISLLLSNMQAKLSVPIRVGPHL
jgi:hypothetical protein